MVKDARTAISTARYNKYFVPHLRLKVRIAHFVIYTILWAAGCSLEIVILYLYKF